MPTGVALNKRQSFYCNHLLGKGLEPRLGAVCVDLADQRRGFILMLSALGVLCTTSNGGLLTRKNRKDFVILEFIALVLRQLLHLGTTPSEQYLNVGDVHKANILGSEKIKLLLLGNPLARIIFRRLHQAQGRIDLLRSRSSLCGMEADSEKSEGGLDTHYLQRIRTKYSIKVWIATLGSTQKFRKSIIVSQRDTTSFYKQAIGQLLPRKQLPHDSPIN